MVKIVPAVLWCRDFDNGEGIRAGIGINDTNCDLPAVDSFLNQKAGVEFECCAHTITKLVGVIDQGHTYSTALAGWFHHDVLAQFAGDHIDGVCDAIRFGHNALPGNGQSHTPEHFLGNNFVHGKGAAVHIAADITVAKNLKETLQRAVFTGRPMQDGEDYVGVTVSQCGCELAVEFDVGDGIIVFAKRLNDALCAAAGYGSLGGMAAVDHCYFCAVHSIVHGRPAPACFTVTNSTAADFSVLHSSGCEEFDVMIKSVLPSGPPSMQA